MLTEPLPDHTAWDDIRYQFYVRKKLVKALDEAAAGNTVPQEMAVQQILSKTSRFNGHNPPSRV